MMLTRLSRCQICALPYLELNHDLMQKYLSGIGIGQNMFQQGGSAAGQMGGNAIDFGKQMGSAKFGENNAMMNQLMAMMQMYQASKNNSAGAGGR